MHSMGKILKSSLVGATLLAAAATPALAANPVAATSAGDAVMAILVAVSAVSLPIRLPPQFLRRRLGSLILPVTASDRQCGNRFDSRHYCVAGDRNNPCDITLLACRRQRSLLHMSYSCAAAQPIEGRTSDISIWR